MLTTNEAMIRRHNLSNDIYTTHLQLAGEDHMSTDCMDSDTRTDIISLSLAFTLIHWNCELWPNCHLNLVFFLVGEGERPVNISVCMLQ